MELSNEIEVNAGVEEVWAAFNDPERIAPCLPGAQLQEIEGEELGKLSRLIEDRQREEGGDEL